jgi:hypothetical protein
MTEAEWRSCTDISQMLTYVLSMVSARKIRLYLCGGCRSIRDHFFRPESLTAVEVAERFADGYANEKELAFAEYAAEAPTFGFELEESRFPYNHPYKAGVVPRLIEMGILPESALEGGPWLVDTAVRRHLMDAANLAEFCANASPGDYALPSPGIWTWMPYLQKVDWPGPWLCHCVFGNPFRPATVDPVWQLWNEGCVVQLAQTAYEDRELPSGHLDPTRLAILADALEDAGCSDPDLISHLRGPGPHVRGCWVVDLFLGKE